MPLWTSKAARYWIFAIASSITFLTFLLFQNTGTHHDRQSIGARRSQKFEAFELEGVSIAVPFPEYPASTDDSNRLELLLENLEARIQVLSDASKRPTCSLSSSRYSTLLKNSFKSRNAHPISLAINLRNSQHVLPSQMRAILTAIHFLSPNHAIYLSIYENDSKDTTTLILAEFASALERVGIDGLWITSSRMRSGITVENRINMLAEFRNAALRPLLPYAREGTVIFINDVILCASDILELILQTQIQAADVVVGVDWCKSSPDRSSPPWVYDDWVLRGINGQMVYQHDIDTPWPATPPDGRNWVTHAFSTQDPGIHGRWLNNLPFPIYAGWGGIVALKAELFTKHGLRFRSSRVTGWTGGSASGAMGFWGELVTDYDYMTSDCPGDSECGLIMRDVWNIRKGRARVVLASQVNTVYSMQDWTYARLLLPGPPRGGKYATEELIDWSNVTIPEGVTCMPSRTEEGISHDAHDTNLFRYLTLDPLWKPTTKMNAVLHP